MAAELFLSSLHSPLHLSFPLYPSNSPAADLKMKIIAKSYRRFQLIVYL